jgi:hypothetical protein
MNAFKISKYNLSKKSVAELTHYKQLINIDITNYKNQIKDYPPARLKKNGIPFLRQLNVVLNSVETELAARKNNNNEGIMD